jgi:hypothetical protein
LTNDDDLRHLRRCVQLATQAWKPATTGRPGLPVDGPVTGLADAVDDLIRRLHGTS